VLSIFVATELYVHSHQQSASDLQYRGVVDGKKVYSLDFLKWRDYSFKIFKSLDSLIYAHALDYYLVGVFLLCVVTNSVYNRFTLMVVMVFTTMQLIPALRKYSIREWSTSAITTTMNIVNSLLFFLMVPYTLTALLRHFWSEELNKTHINDNLLSYLWLIIANCILSDLVKSRDYKEVGRVLAIRQDIEKKFLALFQAYTENESAIFRRINLISKLTELNEIEKNYWKNINCWNKVQFDCNYWHHSLDDSLKMKISDIKQNSLTSWTRLKSNFAETVYEYCHKRTSTALFEDIIFVIMDVVNKNRTVLQEEIINIEDFFHGDYTKYKDVYNQISTFYHYLRNKAAAPNTLYKQKYDAFVKLKEKEANTFTFEKIGLKNFGRREKEIKLVNKDPALLKKAVDVLSKAIIYGKIGKTEVHTQDSKNFVDSDRMICDFGEYRFHFRNLSIKLMRKSQGYQVIKVSIFLEIAFNFLIARIETLVAFLIIFTQVYKGGVENIIILGIIFFGILIETHQGHTKLWSVIYFIYLVKTTISYQIQSSLSLIDKSSNFFKIIAMITGCHNYIIDSLLTLAVFSLIQVLKSRGFSQNYMVTFEDVGTAMARVNYIHASFASTTE
jgi:hypothetical protein